MYSTDFKSLIKKLPKNKENDLVLINWIIDQEFEILGYLLSALKEGEERSFTGIKNEETDKAFLRYWTAGKVYGSLTVIVVSFSEKIIFSLKESGYALNFLYAKTRCSSFFSLTEMTPDKSRCFANVSQVLHHSTYGCKA